MYLKCMCVYIHLCDVHVVLFLRQPIPRPRVNKDSSTHSGSGGSPRKRGVPKDPMAVCRMVLKALEKQEDAWPFLVAVDKRKFREYYQVIKNPMDFATIKGKIKDGKYVK